MNVITHKLFIDGVWQKGSHLAQIFAPFDGRQVAEVEQASAEQLETTLKNISGCDHKFRKSSRFARSLLLQAMTKGIQDRRQDLVDAIVREAGKPRKLADVEVSRAVQTFTLAAEEVRRFGGEIVPVDLDAASRVFAPAVSEWVARGPVLAITPFNFPLNLVAHKVAPALAVGAAVLLKPAPQTPGAAIILAEIFEQALKSHPELREEIPAAALQVICCSNEVIANAVKDPRLTTLSFTGSDKVGWFLQGQAIRKKIALELGGNAAVIVHSDADIARAAARCAFGAFAYSGQVCISVQRVLVQNSVYQKFVDQLIVETKKLSVGDPNLAETTVGPLINRDALVRVTDWVEQAKRDGAKVLLGGTSEKNVYAPTILANCKPQHKVVCEEVFGPIVVVESYDSISEAIKSCNDSRFGLQAGLFTDSATLVQKAFLELEVGGLMVNEIPTYRADNMPYGGVKDSGLGREGVKYAMEEYSERRTLVQWRGASL